MALPRELTQRQFLDWSCIGNWAILQNVRIAIRPVNPRENRDKNANAAHPGPGQSPRSSLQYSEQNEYPYACEQCPCHHASAGQQPGQAWQSARTSRPPRSGQSRRVEPWPGPPTCRNDPPLRRRLFSLLPFSLALSSLSLPFQRVNLHHLRLRFHHVHLLLSISSSSSLLPLSLNLYYPI